MKTHEKKIILYWFTLRLQGKKDWEIRINDCDYQVGDHLILKEYESGGYTGRSMIVEIIEIVTVPFLPKDYVVLSTKDIEKHNPWIPFEVDTDGTLYCIPDDEEQVLISNGVSVWQDTFFNDDDGCYLDSGIDLIGLAWMPLPKPHKTVK